MSLLQNEVALDLAHVMRSHAHAVTEQTRMIRLTVPQMWSMAMLEAHYPALSTQQIKALLHTHCGYQCAHGQRVAVHVDQVLRLDAILAKRLS